MRDLALKLLALTLCLSLSGLNAPSPASESRKSQPHEAKQQQSVSESKSDVACLVLEQSESKIGKVKIYLGKDRVRVDAMNGQTTLLAESPSWDVIIYNKDKQFVKVSRAVWHTKGMQGMMKSRRKFFEGTNPRTEKVTFMGRPALKFTRDTQSGSVNLDLFYRTDHSHETKEPVQVSYIASSQLGLSKGANEFMEGLYLMPPNASVLLGIKSVKDGKTIEHWLLTRSMEERKVPMSLFKAPPNLTPGYSFTAVATGKGIEEMMLNFSGSK